MTRWKEYGEHLFRSQQARDTNITNFQQKEPAPMKHEIEKAISKLKNGKSPGLDGIPAECLKANGNQAVRALHSLCCKIWETCQWPKEWKQQEIIMLHKSGDTKECSNYRTIALISHVSKIMLYVILDRMKQKIEDELAEEQAGFRTGRGTGDILCALQIMIEKLNEVHQEAYIIFIDYSKAFDSVEHEKLFQTLIEMGFPTHLVALIQSLYTDEEIKIRWNNSHTENFRIGAGVRQGCILSPHLFSTYTEQIMREATTENFEIKVGGRKISDMPMTQLF